VATVHSSTAAVIACDGPSGSRALSSSALRRAPLLLLMG
jgi:hypothetical protein